MKLSKRQILFLIIISALIIMWGINTNRNSDSTVKVGKETVIPYGWQLYVAPDKSFSGYFPSQPETRNNSLDIPGITSTTYSFKDKENDAAYAISVLKLPKEKFSNLSKEKKEELYLGQLDYFLEEPSFKLIGKEFGDINGLYSMLYGLKESSSSNGPVIAGGEVLVGSNLFEFRAVAESQELATEAYNRFVPNVIIEDNTLFDK